MTLIDLTLPTRTYLEIQARLRGYEPESDDTDADLAAIIRDREPVKERVAA